MPTLKIVMSEGGIGWVAMLLDRLDNIIDRSGYGLGWDVRPADVLKRNFWFCTIDDPSTIDTRHRIGVENIMVETDYPHGDGTWPDTQLVLEKAWGHIPPAELRAMCSENAARVFRHPLPADRPPARLKGDHRGLHPDRREAHPGPVDEREELVLLARSPVARGLQRPPGRPHHRTTLGDGTLLCNPWLITWNELRPEQVIRIDLEGNLLEGDWPVPLGIPLHLQLHKMRHDVKWAMHNHPLYGTVWSDMGESRRSSTRARRWAAAASSCSSTSTTARSTTPTTARRAVEAMNGAELALLAGHGVFVLGGSARAVHQRAVALEQRCQRAWHVRAAGAVGEVAAAGQATSAHEQVERRGLHRLLGGHGPRGAARGPVAARLI